MTSNYMWKDTSFFNSYKQLTFNLDRKINVTVFFMYTSTIRVVNRSNRIVPLDVCVCTRGFNKRYEN